VVVSPRSSN
jgi:hypothetical protein